MRIIKRKKKTRIEQREIPILAQEIKNKNIKR